MPERLVVMLDLIGHLFPPKSRTRTSLWWPTEAVIVRDRPFLA